MINYSYIIASALLAMIAAILFAADAIIVPGILVIISIVVFVYGGCFIENFP